ncbi:MAG: hypothetical protein JRN45_00705 [Nitrososphaerota archaeon]|nr:hypothetical protein [Nitrososphaerota archaeon]
MMTRAQLLEYKRRKNRATGIEWLGRLVAAGVPNSFTCWHFRKGVPVEERHRRAMTVSQATREPWNVEWPVWEGDSNLAFVLKPRVKMAAIYREAEKRVRREFEEAQLVAETEVERWLLGGATDT